MLTTRGTRVHSLTRSSFSTMRSVKRGSGRVAIVSFRRSLVHQDSSIQGTQQVCWILSIQLT